MPTTRSHSAQVVFEPASQELQSANGQADCDEEVPGSLFVTRGDRSELSEIASEILDRNEAERRGVFTMLNMPYRSITKGKTGLDAWHIGTST
jgi:hypothetical protein